MATSEGHTPPDWDSGLSHHDDDHVTSSGEIVREGPNGSHGVGKDVLLTGLQVRCLGHSSHSSFESHIKQLTRAHTYSEFLQQRFCCTHTLNWCDLYFLLYEPHMSSSTGMPQLPKPILQNPSMLPSVSWQQCT